ncbi:bile acid:sodium symporter [Hoyosella rhizosphaerae]|uniref:Na+-dependent transporter n=1 Tax=Hoyosella rhizosphaerae TaxID=1755582 RepID=A0A916U8Q5_9ACTN|nr:bile acid:sodium symporter family protein [Hoyosella rhizosphaerae]MBN4927502.1 bile acid:sodium symporter [Hoyosella rhizosphaerae]GGC63973.1 putative Na+-dependent transporter [Hoyosella rhizosphaerae]
MQRLSRYGIDGFILAIFGAVLVASVFPATGVGETAITWATRIGIALLFFLYGTRIAPSQAIKGLAHWRLHLVVLSATFILFPVLGVMLGLLPDRVLGHELYIGLLFLCLLPSTVQSSIAFTSIARGNVAGAIVSASASNLIGVFLTPLLVIMLMNTTGHAQVDPSAILNIVLQILLPFIAGQIARQWLIVFLSEHAQGTRFVDRASIVLVVYAAFSESMREGIWEIVGPQEVISLIFISSVLLAVVLIVTALVGRLLNFSVDDRIVIVFCGSKKSLASGLPMATVLFSGASVGMIVLPIMIFHQIQLVVCAILAARIGHARDTGGKTQ